MSVVTHSDSTTDSIPISGTHAGADLPGAVHCRRDQPWQNWGQTARCRPAFTFYPHSLEELIQIVHFAREHGRHIRAVGSGHSWSALVPTDDVLVGVDRLNKVAMDLSDEERPLVIVESGATVKEANDVLEAHGYALPLNVVLESVRWGGLIATGSHGSGWHNGTLSDLVHAIEIVDAAGTLRRFEAGIDSDEVMNAARLNLGMFGLIYRVTLNVQKRWTVQALDRRVPIDEVMANLQDWVPAHDNLDLFWWPYCDQFWVKSWQQTDAPITAKPRRSYGDKVGAAVGARFLQGMLALSATFPRLTPGISRVVFPATPSQADQVVDVVEAIHYRRAIEVARMGCVEIGFKFDRDFANVKWAMRAVIDRLNTYRQRGEYPMNVTMNVRFIHNSACWLSPAFGDGHTCYIEILSRTDQTQWLRFSGEVAQDWLTLPHARPHWAKEYRHIPGVIDAIKANYGDNLARFNQIKAQLGVDPTHLFMNQTLREVFLP